MRFLFKFMKNRFKEKGINNLNKTDNNQNIINLNPLVYT